MAKKGLDVQEIERKRRAATLDAVNTSVIFFKDHHLSTSGQKMNFEGYPYLLDIYFDESPHISVMSSTQTGKSEFLLIKGFALVDLGMNVFHVFATGENKNSFVKSRIDDLCDRVPVYNAMENEVRRNKYLRKMGNANWKFVISNSKTHFDEYPADAVMIDELDSCHQENVKLAQTRMENSPYKLNFWAGNPSVDNYGIAQAYERGTRNEWYFLCPECGDYYKCDFFEMVVRNVVDSDGNHLEFFLHDEEWEPDCGRDVMVKCSKCGDIHPKPVEGKWIAGNIHSPRASYRISKLMKVYAKVEELWEELLAADGNDYRMQIFFNKGLGRPYAGVGAKITETMLDRCAFEYAPQARCKNATYAGMDVGTKFDLQIEAPAVINGKRRRLLANVFRCSTLDEVKQKIKEYNVKKICVGLKPERHLMRQFQEDMRGICDVVLMEELDGKGGMLKVHGMEPKDNGKVINIDRTWMLDEGVKQFKNKDIVVPKHFRKMLGGYWIDSLTSITRVYQNEKEEYRWSKTDRDHFCFANGFAMVAFGGSHEAVMMGDLSPAEMPSDISAEDRAKLQDAKSRQGIGILNPGGRHNGRRRSSVFSRRRSRSNR